MEYPGNCFLFNSAAAACLSVMRRRMSTCDRKTAAFQGWTRDENLRLNEKSMFNNTGS